jgi:bisphosphoglycerate-dependent phosphoglycerate mutase
LRAKTKTKAMWQIINTEIGKSTHHNYKIDLRNGNEIISNLQNVLERLNSFYVETVDNQLNLNNNCINVHTSQQIIDYCLNTMFVYPVTEYEVESVTHSSKGN